ncbi:ankyrin repeat-containing domain protein [Dactylonectria estremocensis]|uniref:Ankyrin repeat-containing domain protein n=1 Tax=Dactylonectria estremocensis TaxID=1079267 RepID=A0A9P9ELL8_9HYPO|nr:ankyrin repeat-containing domain protein [Dactylonectria estremocensis]
MPVNWAEHEREALKLYVEEGRTAEDTIACLNQQHDIAITIRQFKTKFRGLKKLRADEWREVGKEIRKREAKGKACDVYICGRLQDPFRVKRALRHSRSTQSSSTTSIDWNFKVCGHPRIEVRSLDPQVSTQSENEIHAPFPVMSENSRKFPIPESEPAFEQGSGISLGDLGVDMNGIELDFSTPNLDRHFFTDLPSSIDTPRPVEAHSTRQISLSTSWRDTITTHETAHKASPHEPVDLLPTVESSIMISPTGFQVPPSTIRMMHQFGGSSGQHWDIPGRFGLGAFDPEVGIPEIDWEQVNARVPRGKPGWLESQIISTNINLKNLKPIANLLENVLRSTKGDNEIHFDTTTHEPLEQMFYIVTHLVSNQFLTGEKLFNFIEWVLESRFINELQIFVLNRPHNTSNFIREVLVTISDDADWKTYGTRFGQTHVWTCFIEEHSPEAISLITAADSRTISGPLGGKLLVHAAHFNNLGAAKLLIDRGADIDSLSRSNQLNCFSERRRSVFLGGHRTTPLISAIRSGSTHMLEYLLESGADVNICICEARSKDKESALTEAVFRRNFDVVKILLERGAKLYDDLKLGCLSIHKFAKNTSPAIFKLLEEALDQNLDSTATPNLLFLVEAAERGNHSLTKFLLKTRIVQNEVLEAGLCYGVKLGNVGAVRTFLHRGVDPNALRYRLSTLSSKPDKGSDEHDSDSSDLDSGEPYEDEDKDFDFSHPFCQAVYEKSNDFSADSIYLLAKAGASVTESAISRVCRYTASTHCHTAQLVAMVRAGFNVNLVGPTTLELCTSDFSITTCGYLLDKGIDINAYGASGRSALQVASTGVSLRYKYERILAFVQYLLERGADVNLPAYDDGKGEDGKRQWRLTALQAAALGGNGEVVDCLLEASADVRAPPAKLAGFTVLEAAAYAFIYEDRSRSSEQEHVKNFRKLFARGAPVDRTDGTDCNILHYLVRASQMPFLRQVLESGAEPEGKERNFEGQMTPIQVAAHCHNIDAIQLLLDHHADINASASNSRSGRTALQAAADRLDDDEDANDTIEVLLFLLQHHAEVNAAAGNYYGRTALQAATSQNEPSAKVVALLLQHGAKINAPPAELGGITALQGVAASGDIQIARILLSWGADVNAPAALKEGRTAIEAATEHQRLDMVRLLLSKGAIPNANRGWSRAIELAEKSSNWEISDLLREHQRLFNTTDASLICQPIWNPRLPPTPGVILAEDEDYSVLL